MVALLSEIWFEYEKRLSDHVDRTACENSMDAPLRKIDIPIAVSEMQLSVDSLLFVLLLRGLTFQNKVEHTIQKNKALLV